MILCSSCILSLCQQQEDARNTLPKFAEINTIIDAIFFFCFAKIFATWQDKKEVAKSTKSCHIMREKKSKVITFKCWTHGGCYKMKQDFQKVLLSCFTSNQTWLKCCGWSLVHLLNKIGKKNCCAHMPYSILWFFKNHIYISKLIPPCLTTVVIQLQKPPCY